ncbi:uncharacterized protein [Coffea arabica]|uniref:ATP-dependent DNA helicase n=1 Tax=Coffea arabica TaxID=13443 RepID=A0ABM4VU15_COFAR|nr:uncharacterized protein LOC113711186 [Coffea arabica]
MINLDQNSDPILTSTESESIPVECIQSTYGILQGARKCNQKKGTKADLSNSKLGIIDLDQNSDNVLISGKLESFQGIQNSQTTNVIHTSGIDIPSTSTGVNNDSYQIASSSTAINNATLGSQKSARRSQQRPQRQKRDILQNIATESMTLPEAPSCKLCGAKKFHLEPPGFCCSSGEIRLLETEMPRELMLLYLSDNDEATDFRNCIRNYNNMFAFTSIGMHCDKELGKKYNGIYTFRVQGQMYHFINPLVPADGQKPVNLQLYFYDTEHEVETRLSISNKFRENLIAMLADLLKVNPYSSFFRGLQDLPDLDEYKIMLQSNPTVDQHVYNKPTVSQVGALWTESQTSDQTNSKHIQVYSKSGNAQILKHYHGCYDPMQYPLIFPNGEPGWHPGIEKLSSIQNNAASGKTCPGERTIPVDMFMTAEDVIHAENQVAAKCSKKRKYVSCREYYCYKLQIRPEDKSMLLHIGRLLQQYVVDMYVKIETSRLDFFKNDQYQSRLRTELYQGLLDSLSTGETNGSNVGKRFILPRSFIGGPRDMKRRYLDAMTLVQQYGKPDIFLTMTCNKNWPEIKNLLLPTEKTENRPDLVSRVFRAKLQMLKNELFKKHIFGKVAAYTYVIEFQKRGLPHAHFLIILKHCSKLLSSEAYDHIVSAELPDIHIHKHLHSLVAQHMMHGPCGQINPNCPCMQKNGVCKDKYPKQFAESTRHGQNSYPIYRRSDDKKTVKVRGHHLDNRWVVPYNAYLLSKFDCHMNIEICSTIQAVKYIYKYIYKGHDKILYQFSNGEANQMLDEIKNFQSARWISAPEAMWRIYSFDLNEMHPSVMTLPVHLENQQPVTFPDQQSVDDVIKNAHLKKTMLTEFFQMNKYDHFAKNLNCLYTDFPQYFVWDAKSRYWSLRQQRDVIGRIAGVHPSEGERYYLRLLLKHVKKPTSFHDLKLINGKIATSFREAAEFLGLLQADNSAEICLAEAILYQMPSSLRHLFATILVYCNPSNCQELWLKFKHFLSEDIEQNKTLSAEVVNSTVLQIIDMHLRAMGKQITHYGFQLLPNTLLQNHMDTKELQAEKNIITPEEDLLSVYQLNEEQKIAFDKVLHCVNNNISKAFFIDGPGGTGKTYLYKALLATIRSQGCIALATATSGVAASILPGGRTAHSRFKIPINDDQNKYCNISKQSVLAQLIRDAKLIIWDEATMAKRKSVEALDKMLQDITNNDHLFGGKIIVFGGDFRQTLPVITHGTREDIIDTSLVMSPLWSKFEKIRLTINMRARLDPDFSTFLMRIGDGIQQTTDQDEVQIPESINIPFQDDETSINALIDTVFPNMEYITSTTSSIINRAILMTRNDFVHQINHKLIMKFPGAEITYFSNDEPLDSSVQFQDQDLLHSLTPKGLPLHELLLKKNCPVMLLRNINPSEGLSNGTRLICKEFSNNIIQAQIAFGSFAGKIVFIPRIPLQASDEELSSVQFKRTQFPLRLCFAMTINKAQGQTLDYVGLYLREPVFSHGQLYVALSRARTATNIKVLIQPPHRQTESTNFTRNVVYQEVLSAVTNS